MHRTIAAALIALSLTAWPAFAQDAAPVLTSPGFDASAYIGQGDAFNCKDFISQADAQAVLRADPTDPNKLDQGGIPGVACESNRAPKDDVPALP